MTKISENARKKIEALRQAYAEQLPARVQAMESLWISLREGRDSKEKLTELGRQAHGLAGSGATYGFSAVSEKARNLELTLDEIIQFNCNPGDSHKQKAERLLRELKDACLSAARPVNEITQ